MSFRYTQIFIIAKLRLKVRFALLIFAEIGDNEVEQ